MMSRKDLIQTKEYWIKNIEFSEYSARKANFNSSYRRSLLADFIVLKIKEIKDGNVCQHPWASVIGDGEMQPAKCLNCGKVL